MNIQADLFSDSLERAELGKRLGRRSRSGTFTDNMSLPVHGWFRYSAGFSAAWAADEIRDRLNGRQRVLDPFAGAGTTLLAAASVGIPSVGFESHSFVYRIARAKLLWARDPEDFLEIAKTVLAQAQARRKRDQATVPALLEKCYLPEVLEKLDALRSAYLTLRDEANQSWELVWLAITAILRQCSHVGTAQWQYVLPNRQKATWIDPFVAFDSITALMAEDMRLLRTLQCGDVESQLFCTDARSPAVKLTAAFDLVLTSPPYANNYDYADATRLEMTFWREIESWGDLQSTVRPALIRSCSQHSAADRLDLEALLEDAYVTPIKADLTKVCRQLAEVRITKGGKKTYHTMIAAYFCDLARVWESLRALCQPAATVCFVVGDSAPYGVYVPAEQWLGELAVAAGFKRFRFEKLRDRNIKWKNRKHRVPLHEGRLWVEG